MASLGEDDSGNEFYQGRYDSGTVRDVSTEKDNLRGRDSQEKKKKDGRSSNVAVIGSLGDLARARPQVCCIQSKSLLPGDFKSLPAVC